MTRLQLICFYEKKNIYFQFYVIFRSVCTYVCVCVPGNGEVFVIISNNRNLIVVAISYTGCYRIQVTKP